MNDKFNSRYVESYEEIKEKLVDSYKQQAYELLSKIEGCSLNEQDKKEMLIDISQMFIKQAILA